MRRWVLEMVVGYLFLALFLFVLLPKVFAFWFEGLR